MPVHNADISEIFDQVANLLAIEGGNQFRIRAYRRAARNIGNLSRNVSHMVEGEEDLTELMGVGEDLAEKIEEIVDTGELDLLKRLKERVPQGLLEMLKISGLGPKRVRELHEQLGITSIDELKETARATGTILELNASPHRLDIADNYCKMAKENGVKVAISTDAHSKDELNFMKYGVWQARRGWLESEDVVNTRSWDDLQTILKD